MPESIGKLMERPYLIGITGGSGSGKTTILHYIKSFFSEEQLCVISQDNYYRPREQQQRDASGIHNYDLPTAIDRVAFHKDVLQLLAGQPIERLEYTFNNPEKKPALLRFEPRPIIVLEGIFLFHYEEVADLLDLKVFLHAKATTAFARRIKRDRIERNYPLEDVLYRYEHHAQPTYERYIRPFAEQADVVINNNQSFHRGADVLVAFMQQQLQQGRG